MARPRSEPLVSIIIPTYNSGRTLGLALASIERQTYSNIEVIVVDSFSTDSTVDIARRAGARVIQVRGERARAKNIGLRSARGDYVLFIDSDMELTPRVVEEAVEKALGDPRVGGVVIPEVTVGDTLVARIRRYERLFYRGTPVESARFFPRRLALEAGGFDEDLVFFEEATLPAKIRRMGYRVDARIEAPIIHHEEGVTLVKLLRKKYYYAKTAWKYLQRYGDVYGWQQVSPLQRYRMLVTSPGFWRRPHLALAVLGLKTLEYIAAGLGYIAGKLSEARLQEAAEGTATEAETP